MFLREGRASEVFDLAARLGYITLGIYLREMISTCWFEWWLIRRETPFKWPHVPYFVGRYAALTMLIASACVPIDVQDQRFCFVYGVLLPIIGSFSISASSLNLAIRAYYAARQYDEYKLSIWLLLAVGVGQWGVLGFGVARIISNFDSCRMGDSNTKPIAVMYTYSVIYDLFALVLSVCAISKLQRTCSFANLLLKQGFGYFLVAFVGNAIPACFLLMASSEDAIYGVVLFTGPGIAASSIASSRAVTSLILWAKKNPEAVSSTKTPAGRGVPTGSSCRLTSQFGSMALPADFAVPSIISTSNHLSTVAEDEEEDVLSLKAKQGSVSGSSISESNNAFHLRSLSASGTASSGHPGSGVDTVPSSTSASRPSSPDEHPLVSDRPRSNGVNPVHWPGRCGTRER